MGKKFHRKKKILWILISSENKKKILKKIFFFFTERLNSKYSKKNLIKKFYLNKQKKIKK
jgi:hypothetical protein